MAPKRNYVVLWFGYPIITSLFITWLSTRSLSDAAGFVKIAHKPRAAKFESLELQWNQLAQCFVLGRYLEAENFNNFIIDALVQNSHQAFQEFRTVSGFTTWSLTKLWPAIPDEQGIRRIVLDNMCANPPAGFDGEIQGSWSHHLPGGSNAVISAIFFHDLARVAIRQNALGEQMLPPWEGDICRYHTHKDKPDGYSCTTKMWLEE